MLIKSLTLCLLAVFLTAAVDGTQLRGCYLTNWGWARANPGKWSTDKYVPGTCTHIFYAFAYGDARGNVRSTMPRDEKSEFARLNALKSRQPGLKTLISFGGDRKLMNFPVVASTDVARRCFAAGIVAYAKKYGFDGVDIDWELPSAAQKPQFTALIKAIKSAGGSKFLVSAAVTAGIYKARSIYDLPALSSDLDLLNIMGYDYHGSWEKIAGINSPLYGSGPYTLNATVQYYKKTGFPPRKILLGLPTYGRGWTLASSKPGQKPGAAAVRVSRSLPVTKAPGTAAFFELCTLPKHGWSRSLDSVSKSPFIQSDNQWFSYDDVESIKLKSAFAARCGLGGTFIWTLDMDDLDGVCGRGKFPLANAMVASILKPYSA